MLIDGKKLSHVSGHSFIYDSDKGYGDTYIEILFNSGDMDDVESIIGKRITIDIKGIVKCDNFPTVQDYNYAVEGEWHLEWSLSGGEEKREWSMSKKIGDTGITLIYARITPISIYLRFKADDTVGASAEGFGEKHDLYGIKFVDGTIKYDAISEGEYGLVFEKDYDYYMKYNFDNIINPEDISALLFIKEISSFSAIACKYPMQPNNVSYRSMISHVAVTSTLLFLSAYAMLLACSNSPICFTSFI